MRPAIAPVPLGDAVRARVPTVLDVYTQTRRTVLEAGIVERPLKDLCARFLAGDDDVVAHAEDAGRYSERERAALAWAHAISWDSDAADEALWRRLHASFSQPELVELGYAMAFVLGQQHWLQTLGLTPDGTRVV